jgi:hypothetical protein
VIHEPDQVSNTVPRQILRGDIGEAVDGHAQLVLVVRRSREVFLEQVCCQQNHVRVVIERLASEVSTQPLHLRS